MAAAGSQYLVWLSRVWVTVFALPMVLTISRANLLASDSSASPTPFAKDSSALAFVSDGQLTKLDLAVAGSTASTLAENIEGCPSWSPDSTAIALVAEPGRDGSAIRIVADDGSPQRHFKRSGVSAVSWSPDTTALVYDVSSEAGSDIYRLDIGVSTERRLTQLGQAFIPKWSPDNRYIAFLVAHSDALALYTMAVDGSRPQLLTDISRVNPGFEWSPNGKYLAVVKPDFDLYVIDPSTSQQRRITTSQHTAENFAPAWSPDSTKLAFVSTKESSTGAIYMLNLRDGIPHRVTNSQQSPKELAWSTDGQFIAFTSRPGLSSDIYLVAADGSSLQRLTNSDTYKSCLHWIR